MKLLAKKGVKINSEEGDAHEDGSPCFVIAESMDAGIGFLYLTLFADVEYPVIVSNHRIKLVDTSTKLSIKLNKKMTEYINSLPKELFKLYIDE